MDQNNEQNAGKTMLEIMQEVIAKPDFQEYSREVFALASDPVLDLLAPQVDTSVTIGKCRAYGESDKVYLPNTLRPLGTAAPSIKSSILNDTYNCLANALGAQVDVDTVDALELEIVTRNNIYMVASLASYARLMKSLKLVTGALAADSGAFLSDGSIDPVETLDGHVETVLKAGKTDRCGIVFGATAWKLFKNHPKVKERTDPAALSYEQRPTLFTGNARYLPCFAQDPENDEFAMTTEILIFSRSQMPNIISRDFMKRFVHIGLLNGIRAYGSPDGTQLHTDINWKEELKVGNAPGGMLLDTSL